MSDKPIADEPIDEVIVKAKRQIGFAKNLAEPMEEVIDRIATKAAWEIGVASPGFLGLLWNGEAMTKYSLLPDIAIWMLFVGSAASFLSSITLNIVSYKRHADFVHDLHSIRMISNNIKYCLRELRRDSTNRSAQNDLRSSVKSGVDVIDDIASERARLMDDIAAKAFGWLTISGYIFLMMILLSLWYR